MITCQIQKSAAELCKYCYNAFDSFNNLQRIEAHMQIALKVLSTLGLVLSTALSFYVFPFIITSKSLMELSIAFGTFATSVLSFLQLMKASYSNQISKISNFLSQKTGQ